MKTLIRTEFVLVHELKVTEKDESKRHQRFGEKPKFVNVRFSYQNRVSWFWLFMYLFIFCLRDTCMFYKLSNFLIIFGSRLAQLTHFCSLTIKAFTSPLLLYLMTHFFSFKCLFSSAESISITAEIYTSPKFLHHFIDFSSIYFSLVNA